MILTNEFLSTLISLCKQTLVARVSRRTDSDESFGFQTRECPSELCDYLIFMFELDSNLESRSL